MLKSLLSVILAASLCAHAEVPNGTAPRSFAPAQVSVACNVEGKSWDRLLQDFIAGWTGEQPDFCEFKRFLSLNQMISVDMRMNEPQYNQRMNQLYAYNDNSEPVNWLVMNFLDTWAGIFINASMDKEFDHGTTWQSGTTWIMVSVVVISLLVPYMKQFTTRPIRFLRVLINDLYESEPAINESASTLKGVVGLSADQQAATNHLVRPPLVSETPGDLGDQVTRDGFMKDYEQEMIAAGSGVLSHWIAAHGASWGVGLVFPSWTIIFNRANISRTKFIDWAKPPVLAGLVMSFIAADMVAKGTENHQFLDHIDKTRGELMDLANETMGNISPRNELQMWQDIEKIKKSLITQNYLMTKDFMEDLGDLVEVEKTAAIGDFGNCNETHKQVLAEHRALFKRHLAKLIKKDKRNLDAALDLTQSTQLALVKRPDPMTVPLLSLLQQLSVRDRLLMDADVMTESIWRSVDAELSDVQIRCVPDEVLHPAVFP